MQQIHSLKQFLDSYGPSLAKRVNDELAVIHDPLKDEHNDMDQILNSLNKKPFAVQKEVIKAVVKSFKTGNRSVYITAEMGSGKTLMGIASALLLKERPRVLVMCPPHLVRKWIKEIKETVPVAKVVNLNGKHCFSMLQGLRSARPVIRAEFYVIGKERAKTTFQWRPAVVKKGSDNACPGCGALLLNIDKIPLPIFEKNTQGKYKKKYACQNKITKWIGVELGPVDEIIDRLNIKDITPRLDKRKPFKKTEGSVFVYFGGSCNGSFECIFPLYENFDPTKLILNYQYLGDYGYIISSAEYDGDKDDFCFLDGEYINNFELKFE